jgi:hypothetical protein
MDTTLPFHFKQPARALFVGATMSGKTHLIRRILAERQDLFNQPLRGRIVYVNEYLPEWRYEFEHRVEFWRHLPSNLESAPPSLLIIDDFAFDSDMLKACVPLFIKFSHHRNCSLFFVTQNLFVDNKDFRTLTMNCNVYFLFPAPRLMAQYDLFLTKLLGRRDAQRIRQEIFKPLLSQAHGYLVVDCQQGQNYCLRSNIIPSDRKEVVYALE